MNSTALSPLNTPFVILIVDDNANNLFTLRALLQRVKECEIIEASSGMEALGRVLDRRVDLILLDVQMPVMNGLEATKRIREFRTDLPVIALTAYAQTGDEQRILAAGCDEYLPKPIKPEDLKSLIMKYTNTDSQVV